MKVIIFGATGMIGQGTLRESLLAPDVTEVLIVVRAKTGRTDPKLREIVHPDLTDLAPIEADLGGYDACFFCLGVSAAGMSEAAYRRVTYDLTLTAATTLARLSPGSTFVYVSGEGTDSHGRAMWSRVKGETENAVLALDLDAYMFRPGFIQPLHGITSRTRIYRSVYVLVKPLIPLVRRWKPNLVTSTEIVGKAMLAVARTGAPERIVNTVAMNDLVGG